MTTQNYAIDQQSVGLGLTMTSVNTMTSVQISMASLVNGAQTTYTFRIIATSPLTAGDKFIATFPTQVTLPVTPTCFYGSV